jgi:hypothetical protein
MLRTLSTTSGTTLKVKEGRGEPWRGFGAAAAATVRPSLAATVGTEVAELRFSESSPASSSGAGGGTVCRAREARFEVDGACTATAQVQFISAVRALASGEEPLQKEPGPPQLQANHDKSVRNKYRHAPQLGPLARLTAPCMHAGTTHALIR